MLEGILIVLACVCAIAAGICFTIAMIWLCRLLVILAVDATFYIIHRLV